MVLIKISDLILPVLARKNLAKEVKTAEILFSTQKFIQERYPNFRKNDFECKFVKNKILYINTKNSILAQKVYFISEDILEFLNKKYPEKICRIKTFL